MKGQQGQTPVFIEFAAYGQACLDFASGVFQLLRDHDAVVFASAIPRGSKKVAPGEESKGFLRRDKVFLLERFYYHLEHHRESGILVMDGTEKTDDRAFVRRLESYFKHTEPGRRRTQWIVPTPFFVASDMAYPIQAADLVIYCVNWGFRLPMRGMDEPVREEISERFGPWINTLQFRGEAVRDGASFRSFGVFFVPEPTGA